MNTEHTNRTRRSAIVVGGIVPVAMTLVGMIVMLTWLPDLPATVAVHWGLDGPDGFASPLLSIFLPIAIVVVFCAFSVGSAWATRPSGLLAPTQKFVLVTGIWLSAMLTLAIGGSLAIQREISDAAVPGGVGTFMLIGAAAGLVLAAAGWFVLPAADTTNSPASAVVPAAVEPGERVSWSKTVGLAVPVVALVIGTLVVVIAAAVATAIVAPAEVWFGVGALVVVLLLLLFTASWRVTADVRGLIVRNALGWPRVAIPVSRISAVHVVQVDAAAEFGGWGYRWGGPGRTGIILRSGEAIEVTATNGKRFVVTVGDAETGASVLAAYVAQRIE